MKILSWAAVFFTAASLFADLSVEPQGKNFVIKRNNQVLFETVEVKTSVPLDQLPVQESFQTLPDGSKVWNRWCEKRGNRFRLEVADKSNNTIEITLAGENEVYDTNLVRMLYLHMPKDLWLGKSYDALKTNGRLWLPDKQTFSKKTKDLFRWLACDGVILDFNPIGPTDYCMMYKVGVIKGQWGCRYQDGRLMFQGGSELYNYGGLTGAKIVIREGVNSDYDKLHSMRTYVYNQHLFPSKLYSFGADKFGKIYTAGNQKFSDQSSFGWVGDTELPAKRIGSPEGAYYAHIYGQGKRTFKVSGLTNGFYVATVGAGNYSGAENKFDVTINGKMIGKDVSVKKRTAWLGSKTIHVQNNTLEFTLEGNYILSTIAVQPVLFDSEDYSFNRGLWLTNGYEPSNIYRNENYAKKPVFPTSIEEITLPVPGTELPKNPREPERPVWHQDLSQKEFAWLHNVNSAKMLGHAATMAEMDDPKRLNRYMDNLLKDKNYTSIELSGMHTRHTYFSHLERGKAAVGRIVKAAHARNIKLIDHHSTTILWNSDAGPRVLTERLPHLSRAYMDQLPTFQLCPNNPLYQKVYFEYLADLVKLGVDGFQLDEFNYWPHSCACSYCRNEFYRATGCQLPVNELDKNINNPDSELWKRWSTWRDISITNCYIAMRKYLNKFNPKLVLRNYSTHRGYIVRSRRTVNLGWDLFDQSRVLDWVGTEVMTRNVIQTSRSLLPFRRTQNVFTLAYGMPVDAWYYVHDWPSAYFAWGIANMTGQSSMKPSFLERPANGVDFERFNALPINMQRVGSKVLAKAALLFSPDSRDWNVRVSYPSELYGLAQTLETLHIPYEFVGSMSLNEKVLSKYKLLAISGAGCLSDQEIEAIKAFARNGGTVYLSTIAGAYTQYGVKRKVWPFKEIFGFSPGNPRRYKALKAYRMQVTPINRPVTAFLPKNVKKPNLLQMRAKYGKGEMIYCSMAIASELYESELMPNHKWGYNHDAELQKLYQKELTAVFKSANIWQTDAPEKVFTSLWQEKDGSIVVHFINAQGACMKPGQVTGLKAPVPAFPPVEKDITFTIAKANCREVIACSPDFEGGRALKFKQLKNGKIQVVLPKELFKVYTMVRIR
ncbi:MAG: hypothetical protein E7052_00385 [Lentisphaerae bacterium]|nr:hypothetical protein [Lentisphaerota bacterium]